VRCMRNLQRPLLARLFSYVADLKRGDVVQLARALLSHRHNDVSDLKISNLVQPTSVRPVTVSAFSLHFRKRVVRSLEDPDVFLLRDRSASRMANSFRQELIAELFDEES
jgi:hypothetical protein